MAESPETPRPASWSDLLARTLELGFGVVALTAEAAEKLVSDLVRSGQVAREESQTLTERLTNLGREGRTQVVDIVDQAVDRALSRMDLARASEVAALRSRLTRLEAHLADQLLPGNERTSDPTRQAE
jgi:polyhydroxyalkanoate synthesis regulator phasin